MEKVELNTELSAEKVAEKEQKQLEKLDKRKKRKLVLSKSGLEPDPATGKFKYDPTVPMPYNFDGENAHIIVDLYDSYMYKQRMAVEIDVRKKIVASDPTRKSEYYTADGSCLKYINPAQVFSPSERILRTEDNYLAPIWFMWKNRETINSGAVCETKISKYIKTDSRTYVADNVEERNCCIFIDTI